MVSRATLSPITTWYGWDTFKDLTDLYLPVKIRADSIKQGQSLLFTSQGIIKLNWIKSMILLSAKRENKYFICWNTDVMIWAASIQSASSYQNTISAPLESLVFQHFVVHVASLQYTQIHTVHSLIGSLNPCLTPFPCVPNLSRLIATGRAELRQSCLYSFYLSAEVSTQRLQTAAPFW